MLLHKHTAHHACPWLFHCRSECRCQETKGCRIPLITNICLDWVRAKYAVNLYCLPPLFWIYPRGRNVKKHHLATQPAQLKRENHTQAANYEKKQVVNKKNRLFKTRISLQPYCIRAGMGSDSVHLSSFLSF